MHGTAFDRLYFDGGVGVARLGGKEVPVHRCPMLAGLTLLGVDYAPALQVAIVRPVFGGWREMYAGEIAAAEQLLKQLTQKDERT